MARPTRSCRGFGSICQETVRKIYGSGRKSVAPGAKALSAMQLALLVPFLLKLAHPGPVA